MIEQFSPKALSPARAQAVKQILNAALNAVDPARVVENAIELHGNLARIGEKEYDLSVYRQVLVVGVGKACVGMAEGAMRCLGERIHAGLLIGKHAPGAAESRLTARFQYLTGNHPIPGEDSVQSAGRLAAFLTRCDPQTLVICLISGGGSALMALPEDGVSLIEMQQLTQLLLACGADIGEINAVRKHLDRIKGGGLAQIAAPARVVSLILSDVVGNPLDVIASGPTVADPTTFQDVLAIFTKYGIEQKVPPFIMERVVKGCAGALPESLKPVDPALQGVDNLIIGDNRTAAMAALEQAQKIGFINGLLTNALTGEARQVGKLMADQIKQLAVDMERPLCMVAGGETTVTLCGSGLGGRNQEVALGAVEALAGVADAALVTLATDGEDGPSGAAGAVVTGESLTRARSLHLDVHASLEQNDSTHFFGALGDLVISGPTGTNVNDLNFLFLF